MGKFILRRLLRSPMFTAITLLTLAIGIGANTAIFSVINGVLLKPLPYSDPERLVGLWHTAPGLNLPEVNMAPANYFTYREQGRAFEDVGLYTGGSVSVTEVGQPERVETLRVTDGTLPILGVRPELGRTFTRLDDTDGSPRTAVLTWGYWQQRFGGSPAAIGKRIVVDGRQHEIIGVLPRSFQFMDREVSLVLPLQFSRNKVVLGNFSFQGIARLKPGMTLESANADVGRMLPIWAASFPPPPGFSVKLFQDARLTPAVRPFKQDVVGDIGEVLWVLMGTIGAVLLIACANVANLLLVRAEGRQHELAIRSALGAGRGRIARELLFESLTLGVAGGALGLAVAYGTIRLLIAIGPSSLPRLHEIAIDPVVLAFAFFTSLLAGGLFGILPVWKYAGVRLNTGLRESGRTVSQSRERHRARSVLVIVQVALALVLLIGSGLMIRTFQALRAINPGFTRPEQVLVLSVSIPEGQVKEDNRVARMDQDIVERLSRMPGVGSAALVSTVSMTGDGSNDVLFAEDHPIPEGRIPPIRRYKFISPGFFQTVGNPIVAGRDITWTDVYNYRNVALVSENLAREYWHDPARAIGKRIREGSKDDWREIVGVVGNSYDNGVNKKAAECVYWPFLMKNFWGGDFVQRTATFTVRSERTGSAAFLDEVRQAVWAVSANSPVANVRTLQDVYSKSMARTSFTLVMLAIAGGMALVLGLIGIYGVISYSVSQRRREIGIRMALGARQSEVNRMFLRHGLMLAAIGVGFGLAAAAGFTRLISSLLFGVSTADPVTYAAMSVGLVGAAMLASYLPARRASGVNPVETLRAE
jgi:predicted permease